MEREISSTCLELIKQFEGLRLISYQDSAGVWTIGYGHTAGVVQNMRISKSQAEMFLKEDLAVAIKHVNTFMPKYNFNQNQFDALVSFAFNIGSITQLTAKRTRTIEEISRMIPAYCKAGGKTLLGLQRRRKAEKDLFDKGVTDEQIVKEVLDGLWGTGAVRKSKLTKAGYDYNHIQALVNTKLGK